MEMDLHQNNKHKRIKRRRVIINFLVLIFLVISCKKPIQSNNEFPFENIVEKLDKVLADKQIDIAKLTPFDWEQLYIFKPYTPISIIDSKLGYIWSGAEKTFINQEEEFDLLIFTENDKVINYIKWPINKGDFMRIEKLKYSYDSAKFIFKKEKYGGRDKIFIYEIN